MFTSFLYLTYIVYQMSVIMSTLFEKFFCGLSNERDHIFFTDFDADFCHIFGNTEPIVSDIFPICSFSPQIFCIVFNSQCCIFTICRTYPKNFYRFFEIPFMLFHSAVDVVCGADFKNAVAFSNLNKVDKILFFQCAILPFVFLQCYYTASCILCQAKNTKLF